jgi:serine/threonine-protein kinase
MLARRDARTSFCIGEVVDVVGGIAEALAVVHGAGMAHRDVKPANVILAPDDRVVLTDFGLFRPESEPGSDGHLSGSPPYMAPETICGIIARGEAFLVDVYALGVVAYELLTGTLPFTHPDLTRSLWMHLTRPVPDPTALRADIPPCLAELVRAMLAKDPRARPQGMDEVLWQLRDLREGTIPTRLRVLIAEDNPGTASILASIVHGVAPDADVRIAGDGCQTLQLVASHPPDLLVIDLHLPRLSGIEVCLNLRSTAAASRCEVLGTSSHAARVEVELLRRLGFQRFVPKGAEMMSELPVLLEELQRKKARRSLTPPHGSGTHT